ncbi:hypothetical protein CHGG_00457 [Chaetomium globosum CBS 148.51]|uniref:PH domain-containing protein n=1 Tax=Chaetomium globosum (strain ATCC 6205 / CBS 148.51 / DSM 1962 / NBRC 6347 / NRRL 1970) TaxID=306901 RepID=Q2HH47_CHAGB|nr:uncharacterized protein CHGG_00457 [Chaetomium globosum CBS 148.51]EAQ92222.1 hypothetical protein CHGG_00457 [Chaetomium globosum CBS 148.51]
MSTVKGAVASTPQANGYDRTSHSPHPQAQQTHHHSGSTGTEALPNTAANSHGDYGDHMTSPASMRPPRFIEEWDASQRGSSVVDDQGLSGMQRSASYSGHGGGVIGDGSSLSRGNTLRKKASIRRSASLKRSGSRRSMKAGSVRSLALQPATDQDEMHSAFYCPVPTAANPTEALANRFQAWRKTLKDLIIYFREIQTHYEHRAKSLIKLANVLNNTATPPGFLSSGGLDDALQILRGYNKQAIAEANKAREIEEDVILALTGLRSDLHQKIKEIKNLSGDFKNSVDKEMDSTRKAVNQLQEALGQNELDPALTIGKQDPYILRLAVDRQLERQIDEENYLHQAYLNLENSGNELESIVVGEIQKAYNAYAGILKRESDAAYHTIEELRAGPVSMAKDTEWTSFIQRDDRFVNPELPMRLAGSIHYPGRDHYACQEIRAGLLERKSKYLKSYTPGWALRSSVSSDGVDDDEEPPFTATVSSVNQQSRQDGLSRRPSGGRFPSDLQVNAQRGLQVPVSPLSASSGYGESLNHHDPFIATVPTKSDLSQHPQGLQNHSQPRGTEPGSSQRLTTMDGSMGGPVQFPNPAATTGPQRRSLQVPGMPGHSTTTTHDVSPVDRGYDSQTWAEPVPIPLPHPHQQLSSTMDGGGSEIYDPQGIRVLDSAPNGNKVEAQTSRGGEKAGAQAGDDGIIDSEISARPGGAVRVDSAQTISHLHIPGQYPRGSNAGL